MNIPKGQLPPEVIAQIKDVQKAIATELLLQRHEGIPLLYLLYALAMATTELIKDDIGPEYVLPWFTNSAQLVENIQKQGDTM